MCFLVEAALVSMYSTSQVGLGLSGLLCIWMNMRPLQPESRFTKCLCFIHNLKLSD